MWAWPGEGPERGPRRTGVFLSSTNKRVHTLSHTHNHMCTHMHTHSPSILLLEKQLLICHLRKVGPTHSHPWGYRFAGGRGGALTRCPRQGPSPPAETSLPLDNPEKSSGHQGDSGAVLGFSCGSTALRSMQALSASFPVLILAHENPHSQRPRPPLLRVTDSRGGPMDWPNRARWASSRGWQPAHRARGPGGWESFHPASHSNRLPGSVPSLPLHPTSGP